MKAFLSVLLFVFFSNVAQGQHSTDSLITVLKFEIAKTKWYDNNKEKRINALKNTLLACTSSNLSLQYTICNKIYEEYKNYKFDSAYVYSQKLLQISNLTNDISKKFESIIKLGSIQLSGGMFKETFDCIRQINTHLVDDSIKLRYFALKSRALRNLALNNTDQFYFPVNYAEATKMLDSVMLLTKPGSFEHFMQVAQSLTLSGHKNQAAGIIKHVLTIPTLSDHQRAMATNDLSNISSASEQIRLLTLSAIYDIRSSTKQTRAAYTLGTLFFKAGTLDDAEILLKDAFAQVSFYGNKPREREISSLLTQVTAQKLINFENKKNQVLTILILVAVLALIGLAFVSIIVFYRLKKVKIREAIVQQRNQELDGSNKKLLEDAHIKEEYIGYFFNVISGYILKIEKIKRTTERKLKAKNYDELLQVANEIDIKKERENLFYTFDKIFLKLFPNFLASFNSLLKPEDQIWPKANEVLNTNLRIFALIRLGIHDNQKIANILESAVSTIYTYKTRIKSKALVPVSEFDNMIMEIKFVDTLDHQSKQESGKLVESIRGQKV